MKNPRSLSKVGTGSHLEELDGLRGIAILLVLGWHFPMWFTPEGTVTQFWLSYAWSGVDLFFVLSGFLMFGNIIDHRDSPGFQRTFLVRRAARILPLYLLLTAILILARRTPSVMSVDWLSWLFKDGFSDLTYLTLTQNVAEVTTGTWGIPFNDVTWSLAIEVQFYLALVILAGFLSKKTVAPALGFLFIGAIGLRFYLYAAEVPNHVLAVHRLMPARLDAFALGGMMAFIIRSKSAQQYLSRNSWTMYGTAAVTFVTMFEMARTDHVLLTYHMGTWGYTVVAMFYASILGLVLFTPENWLHKFLKIRALCFVGTISYGLYLLQRPVLSFIYSAVLGRTPNIYAPRDLTLILVATLTLFLVAYASRRWFEEPFLRLAKRAKY